MKPLGLNEIRERYLSFFEKKDHLRMPSFSLVPQSDPSILLINAGMTPLKPYFTGAQTPPALRITTCQKCIRTPDIDNVGITSRHGTYFEMLGNFSFGDYFKKEAIDWAWEFCTKVLEIPENLLFPSVYEEDNEAFEIWRDDIGIDPKRIYKLGKEDNFWEHGTGPCGPCSEIYFDRGEQNGCDKADCAPGCDCDRFVEIWNLVFTQFNKEEDGAYTPLEKKNIDTGGGLERFACVMQGVNSLFEVDTIRAILDAVCNKANITYGVDAKKDMAIRVITDHTRSSTMMISDGVLPSNEGRGYVLRRLMRRASRFGRILGIKDLFLTDIAQMVIHQNKDAYPTLLEKQSYIMTVIRKEEEAFARTVEQGTIILQEMIEKAKKSLSTVLSGEDVFRLHDTYGFPLDLTREIAAESNLTIDESGFDSQMKAQKESARAATKAKTSNAWVGKELPEALLQDRSRTSFVGYDVLDTDAHILYILTEDDQGQLQTVSEAKMGDQVIIIVDQTPFYATSGGQMNDVGQCFTDTFKGEVIRVDKDASGKFLHGINVMAGEIKIGQAMRLSVKGERRMSTARNHTATHILQKALREVLGDHVEQSGSFVSHERLRFDFTHFQPLTPDELERIETLVNKIVLEDLTVNTQTMSQDEARKMGAMALFGEKYDDEVRVILIGDDESSIYSMELCGGTHLTHTGQIGQFRIISETGIASGVRRIEAMTGWAAYEKTKSDRKTIEQTCCTLKVLPEQLTKKLESMAMEIKELEKELAHIKSNQVGQAAEDLVHSADKIGDVSVVVAQVKADGADALREAADKIRDRLETGVVVLATQYNNKVMFVVMADAQAIKKGIHSGSIVRAAAQVAGGGGGGRPDMAQAGGKDVTKTEDALKAARLEIINQIG